MRAKMSGARRAAFLKALGKTGNYAVACEQAGVSRGWVLKARGEEPGFDAACREAVAAVDARLRAAGAGKGGSWGHLDGVQLVVRGTGGSGGGRRVQIGRARAHQWGPRTESAFLAVLAATCNVKAAYEAAGMSKGSAYTHRKRWPGFARRWDEAVEAGALRLEFALVAAAWNPFSCDVPEEPAEAQPEETAEAAPPMRPDDMFHNLYMHKHLLCGSGGQPGRTARPPTIEAVTAKVVRNVEAIRGASGIDPAVLARDREAFAMRGAAGAPAERQARRRVGERR